jgi:hypothetical protein
MKPSRINRLPLFLPLELAFPSQDVKVKPICILRKQEEQQVWKQL